MYSLLIWLYSLLALFFLAALPVQLVLRLYDAFPDALVVPYALAWLASGVLAAVVGRSIGITTRRKTDDVHLGSASHWDNTAARRRVAYLMTDLSFDEGWQAVDDDNPINGDHGFGTDWSGGLGIINPATGLPMVGSFDAGGNAYGFSDDWSDR
jgi:hypothetical protein